MLKRCSEWAIRWSWAIQLFVFRLIQVLNHNIWQISWLIFWDIQLLVLEVLSNLFGLASSLLKFYNITLDLLICILKFSVHAGNIGVVEALSAGSFIGNYSRVLEYLGETNAINLWVILVNHINLCLNFVNASSV
jgi:hypothetical protein